MLKNPNNRLYAIVDATDEKAVGALKAALMPYEPKYREGKTVVIGGFNDVLFVEFCKREGPIFDIMKNLANSYNFYPFYVIEEGKSKHPKKDKFGNSIQYFVVEAAIADFAIPTQGFDEWLKEFRAVAKAIHHDDSVFLKLHGYLRKEDGTVHVLLANTESVNRQAKADGVKLGEKGWKEAVLKMASLLKIEMEFKKIRYKYL